LKPRIYGWLFPVEHHPIIKPDMVKKSWNHTYLQRAFKLEFQKQVMVDDIKTPLFKTIKVELAVEINNNQEDNETCIEVSSNNISCQRHTRTQYYIYKAIPITAKDMIEKKL
jgi:hypothetical protein